MDSWYARLDALIEIAAFLKSTPDDAAITAFVEGHGIELADPDKTLRNRLIRYFGRNVSAWIADLE
jgi:hypothetical protein